MIPVPDYSFQGSLVLPGSPNEAGGIPCWCRDDRVIISRPRNQPFLVAPDSELNGRFDLWVITPASGIVWNRIGDNIQLLNPSTQMGLTYYHVIR